MIKTVNGIFIIAGTVIMIYVMAVSGKSLKTPETALGILNLEFAYNKAKTNEIMNAWSYPGPNNIDNISVAIQNTWYDFIFLFFYALVLFYSCKSIASSFKGFLQKTGKYAAVGSLYAGLLDIAENAGMLFTLNGYSSDMIALLTVIFSVLKWLLVIFAILYIILTGPAFLLNKYKK